MSATIAVNTNRAVAARFNAAAEAYDAVSNPYAVHRRATALAAMVEGRCLEVGGGTGAITERLPGRSQAIHSDIAPRMCRVAADKLGCRTVCFDAEAIPLADASVDTVVSAEVIYYLQHPERFFQSAYRVLRPGGRLLLSTTNPWMTWLDRGRSMLRRIGFGRMFFDDGSPRFPAVRRLVRGLQETGFAVEFTRPIIVLPFASLDRLNRFLERTLLDRFALFLVIVAKKKA